MPVCCKDMARSRYCCCRCVRVDERAWRRRDAAPRRHRGAGANRRARPCMPKARRSTNARRAPTASWPGRSASRSRRCWSTARPSAVTTAGPTWEHSDGSAVVGKAVGNAPGATPHDIPWLKLEVISPARQRHALRRHDGAADQHHGRQARRRLRQGRHVQERALLRGLCVPAQVIRALRAQAPAIAFSIAASAASALAPSGPPACAMSGRPPPPLPPSASDAPCAPDRPR